MKLNSSCLALILTLLFGGFLAYAQDPAGPRPKKARTPDDYTLRTLKEVQSASASLTQGQPAGMTTLVDGDLFPSRVRVTCKGAVRPLTPEKKDVIFSGRQIRRRPLTLHRAIHGRGSVQRKGSSPLARSKKGRCTQAAQQTERQSCRFALDSSRRFQDRRHLALGSARRRLGQVDRHSCPS